MLADQTVAAQGCQSPVTASVRIQNLPFFGDVVSNIIGLMTDLGKNGLAGGISVAIILWLFSKRPLV